MKYIHMYIGNKIGYMYIKYWKYMEEAGKTNQGPVSVIFVLMYIKVC